MNEYLDKNDLYFGDNRIEMLKFVPEGTKKILDIGCGQGLFGKLCKEELNCVVHGIELVDKAAEIAKKNIDKVLIGDVYKNLDLLENEYYDLIVLNDVIEHIPNPEELISLIKNRLNHEGVILFSVPNFRYIYNLIEVMLKKNFDYTDSGTLDKTHLTFFTKNSFKKTVEKLDYKVISVNGINEANSLYMKLLKPFLKIISHEDVLFYQFAFLIKPVKNV